MGAGSGQPKSLDLFLEASPSTAIREGGDNGKPIVVADPNSPVRRSKASPGS